MAVDKSFVVKNGLEVNSDLIVTDISDSQNKKVGIASTGPRTTLDVRGGIAATDGNFSGILTAASVDISNFGAIRGTEATITGFSTLGGLTVDQLTVSGVATFADLSYDEITGRNINITGIATIPVFDGTTAFNDGVTVVGVVTAAHFDGGGLGVGVRTTGSIVGYGFTMLNFVGAGNTFAINGTTVDISIAGGGGGGGSASIGIGTTVGDAFSGIVTAGNLWYNTGEGRLFIYYQDVDSAQWVDAAPFNVGIITTLSEISFVAGSAAAPSISFGSDSDSGFFSAGTDQPGVTAAGSQVARFNPGGVNVSGVVTATSFSGDGAGLTSLPAGLGTALNSDKSTFLGNVYYQDQVFSIGSTVTIDVPSTAIVGYTPYADIQVSDGADLIVADGDEFIPNILGIGTDGVNSLGGSGGRIRADNYINSAGTGAPTFPSGVNITGVATATQFKADSAIFSGNVSVAGTLTYQDVTNMDVLGIGTFQQGIQVLANGINIVGGGLTVGGELTVAGVSTFSNDIFVGRPGTSEDQVRLYDNTFLRFGDSNDFFIMHDGSDAITKMKEDGGRLRISANPLEFQINDVSIATITGAGITVAGIATASRFGGYDSLVATASSEKTTYLTTVAAKTADHRYFGTGSSSGYFFDGIQSPIVTLTPGKTYFFDQSDSSNSSHPLRFYLESDKTTQITDGVTAGSVSAGTAGAGVTIVVGDSTPSVLHYQCTNHGYMGNAVTNTANVVNTNHDTRFGGFLREGVKVTAGKLSDNANIDVENGNVFLFTTAESTTSTPNIRYNASTSFNSKVAIGEAVSVTIVTTAAAAGYSAQLTIDGGAITENWTGGSAPSDGGSSGVDIYAYTIMKTADATFTVIATQTKTS